MTDLGLLGSMTVFWLSTCAMVAFIYVGTTRLPLHGREPAVLTATISMSVDHDVNVLPKGVRHIPGLLNAEAQRALVEDIRAVVEQAPLYRPEMPRTGKPLSVRMTNCGSLGWVADKAGYRYQPLHPVTGEPWPPIPEPLLALWREVSAYAAPPEACLVNFYEGKAKMGLHQDRDEDDLDAPVVSISLGDECLFRIGETSRGGRTTSIRLRSGDVVVLGGEGRLAFHGVDRIYPATSALLKKGGRINLTLRRVTRPVDPRSTPG